MNAPLRDSCLHCLFHPLDHFASRSLKKLGTLQHFGVWIELHISSETDLLHAECPRCFFELRVRSWRKFLHPPHPLSTLPPGSKLQDDVIAWNELGISGQSPSDFVIGFALHHDSIFHNRESIFQGKAEPALGISHALDPSIPEDAWKVFSLGVMVDHRGPLSHTCVPHSLIPRPG